MSFHLKEAKYTFFSNAHRTLSKTDHMRGHKTSLKKFKETEIVLIIFSEKTQKRSNSWKLNSMLLMNGLTMRSRKKIKSFLEKKENEHTTIQKLWNNAKAFLRGKLIAIQAYLKNIETLQINYLIL